MALRNKTRFSYHRSVRSPASPRELFARLRYAKSLDQEVSHA